MKFKFAEINFFFIFFLVLESRCPLCPREFHIENGVKRPTIETFNKYLPYFLMDIPDAQCAKAGKAAYSSVRLQFSTKKMNQKMYDFSSIYL